MKVIIIDCVHRIGIFIREGGGLNMTSRSHCKKLAKGNEG